jgi:uncharacterized protein YaiI (UPF0178 family)
VKYTSDTLTDTVRAGDLVKAMWLHTEQHCELNRQRFCDEAAMAGSIQVLEWLKQLGVDPTEDTCDIAAEYGYMHVLQYLHAEGCAINQTVCNWAAYNGDLVMLKWAHEHGCPLYSDELDICDSAAGSHNVELMAWLIQQPDMELTVDVFIAARNGERLAFMQHLQQEGAVFTTKQLTDLLHVAGVNDSLQVAKGLRQQGAEWPAVLRYHSESWSGDILARARAEGCTSPVE